MFRICRVYDVSLIRSCNYSEPSVWIQLLENLYTFVEYPCHVDILNPLRDFTFLVLVFPIPYLFTHIYNLSSLLKTNPNYDYLYLSSSFFYSFFKVQFR